MASPPPAPPSSPRLQPSPFPSPNPFPFYPLLIATLLLLLAPYSPAATAVPIPATCYPNFSTTPPLRKFIDPLPILKKIDVSSGKQVVLGAYKIKQRVHSELPETTLYAFGESAAEASYPGPTLEAVHGKAARVRWENHISDTEHMLAVDRTLEWANPGTGAGVPIVSHLHGGQVKSSSDGHPDSWFTSTGVHGNTYAGQNYTYLNTQDPATLWYHDHTVGITRLNVFAGLMGLYIIRSGGTASQRHFRHLERLLPTGAYEIPLIIQDKEFYSNGSLQFPYGGNAVQAHPNWCAEFFGDVVIVNGRIWPYLDVEPALYRFRLLNAANSRFFTLSLSNATVPVWLIGTDGGYLHGKPIRLRPAEGGGTAPDITLGPGERLDLLVDFSGLKPGVDVIYLNNSASAPFPVGFPVFDDDVNTKVVMMFRVVENATLSSGGGVKGELPERLPGRPGKPHFHSNQADAVRTLELIQIDNNIGSTQQVLLDNRTWTDAVTETPRVGSTEIWRIVNLSNRTHPIHVHLISFVVLDEQTIDAAAYVSGTCSLDAAYGEEGSCYTEALHRPANVLLGGGNSSSRAWKDTVSVAPATVTRFLLTFMAPDGGAFPFDATEEPGYLWHCHMVDHEDNDMMRPMKLLPE